MAEKTYTTFQIADMCGVRPTTIIKWIKQNKLRAFATVGGHRRIRESDLVPFLNQYGFPVPDALSRARKRLLLVEDDIAVGQLLQRAIGKASDSVDIEWTKDGIEALLALGKRLPDLMVLDVVMPVVDGAKVLATLRADERTRNVKVIGMTGKRLPPEKMKFFQRHTDAFYLKPFNVNEFVEKVLGLLRLENAGSALQAAEAKR